MESSLPVQAVSLSGKQKTKLSIKISLQQFAPLKMCKYEFTSNESEPGLETVMNELRKNQKGISNLKYLKPPDEGILQFLSYSSLHKSKVDHFFIKINFAFVQG